MAAFLRGGALDDGNELYVFRLQLVAQEAVHFAAMILVAGVHGGEEVVAHAVAPHQLEAVHHAIEAGAAALIAPIAIVYLARTVDAFAGALRAGGVVIVEPWLTSDTYEPGRVFLQTYEDDDCKVARMAHSAVRGEVSVLEFEWTIARRGSGIDRFSETHEMWMCSRDAMREELSSAFDVRFEEEGLVGERGLFVGVRRSGN